MQSVSVFCTLSQPLTALQILIAYFILHWLGIQYHISIAWTGLGMSSRIIFLISQTWLITNRFYEKSKNQYFYCFVYQYPLYCTLYTVQCTVYCSIQYTVQYTVLNNSAIPIYVYCTVYCIDDCVSNCVMVLVPNLLLNDFFLLN